MSYAFRLIYEPDKVPEFEPIDLSEDISEVSATKETMHFKITPFVEICPQPVSLVMVGSSAFFSVILLGVLTICIWKIVTEYLDRREYERFTMEVDAANFTQVCNSSLEWLKSSSLKPSNH